MHINFSVFILHTFVFMLCLHNSIAAPLKYKPKVLGKEIPIEIHPTKTFMKFEPFLYKATTTLQNYKEPVNLSKDENRLAKHRENTKSKVDENGLPWSRPPPPGHLDMEELLDQRHYQRWEQMIQSGEVLVNPDTHELYYPGTSDAVDPEEDMDMLSMLGKDNGRKKNKEGMTLFESYMNGDVDIAADTLWGEPIESSEQYIVAAYGLPTE